MNMFNNLIFNLSICVNFSVWVSAFTVVSKRKYFHFFNPGVLFKMLAKQGGRVCFRYIKVYQLKLDVSNLYLIKDNVQSYNKSHANIMLAVII